MNPATLMRIWAPFAAAGMKSSGLHAWSAHTLQIAGHTNLWPQAIYTAYSKGYLRKTAPSLFTPTEMMLAEVRRVEALGKERQPDIYTNLGGAPSRLASVTHLRKVQ